MNWMIASIMQEVSVSDHLARLVAFPTISSVSNLTLLDWIEEYCRAYGGRSRRFFDATGTKANLLVSVGPDQPGGIVLSGHTDVVPCEGQAWLDDPFILRRDGARLVGRGSTDMKGFLACCLAALPNLARSPLRRPLHLAFSYDEEVGCTGVGSMADWIGLSDLKPGIAIIGEPSSMRVINAHKAGLVAKVSVKGKPGHSSQPELGVNAVMTAAGLIAEIEDLRVKLKTGPFFEQFSPRYATTQVNMIQGGTQLNIIAEHCQFMWELRALPGQDDMALFDQIRRYAAQTLEPAMKAIDPACGITFEVLARVPALQPNIDCRAEAAIFNILGQSAPEAVAYGSEAGIFQAAGIPAIICGPGNIAQAHQPEEFIEQAELDKCVDFLLQLGQTLTTSDTSLKMN